MSSKFLIDTKGSCLLCFRSRNNGEKENGVLDPGFKTLLHYLEVDVTKLSLFASTLQRLNCPVKNVDLAVSLCDACSGMTNAFFELFQTYEEIRNQLELMVGRLIHVMEEGNKDGVSVRKYEERMSTGYMEDIISTTIADELRKETKDKAVLKVGSTMPKLPVSSHSDDMDVEEGNSEVSLNDFTTMTPVHLHPNPKASLVTTTTEVNETSIGNYDSQKDDSSPTSGLMFEKRNRSAIPQVTRTTNNTQRQSSLPIPEKQNKTPTLEVNLKARRNTEFQESGSKVIEGNEVTNVQQKAVTTTGSSQSSSPWKCDYCGKNFSQERNLINHHYTTHTMAILKDNELLPPNITEQQLSTALEQILEQSTNQCPVCETHGFRWKFLVRSHLLQCHLKQVIEKVDMGDDLPENIPEVDSAHSNEEPNWHCVPCEKEFPTQDAFDLHQNQKHQTSESVLSEEVLLPADITRRKSNRILEKNANGKANSFGGEDVDENPNLQKNFQKTIPNSKKTRNRRSGKSVHTSSITKKKYLKPGPSFKKGCNCVPCGRSFPSGYKFEVHQLNNHLMSAIKDRIPSSLSKEKMTTSLASIIAQMKRISRSNRGAILYQCLWCEKKVWTYTYVKVHMLKCHLDQVIQVAEKGKVIMAHSDQPSISIDESGSSLENREESIDVPSQTKCEYCGKDFANRRYLEVHKSTQHTFSHLSNKGLLPPDVTEQHLNRILTDLQKRNDRKILECQICKKEGFQSICRLRAHLFADHVDEVIKSVLDLAKENEKCQTSSNESPPGPSSRFECNTCGKMMVSEHGLSIHYAVQHRLPSKSYKCNHCDKRFAVQASVDNHLTSCHPVVAFEGHLPIWVTDQDFNNAVALVSRMSEQIKKTPGNRNTSGSYLWECSLCKKRLNWRNQLMLHIARCHLDRVVDAMETRDFGEEDAENLGNGPSEDLECDKMEGDGIDEDYEDGDIEIVYECGPVSID